MMTPPNGLALSCAASLDREGGRLIPAFKMATILEPQSGVSYSAGLGRGRLGV